MASGQDWKDFIHSTVNKLSFKIVMYKNSSIIVFIHLIFFCKNIIYETMRLKLYLPVFSIDGFPNKLYKCAYTCDLLSDPNSSLISTTIEHGLSTTKIPERK